MMASWQTKDITDEMVVVAVARYQDAMRSSGYSADVPFPYEAIAEETGAPIKVAYAACERACRRDLIEYGVSLRTGWLTDKGEALQASVVSRKMVGDTGIEPVTSPV